MSKPLPRVVCSIDGSTLPVQDYSFTSVANGGYHEFRGQAPVRRLLALGADQEAPLTVYHEETGDILWDGRFVTDPEVIEGIGLISATGPKSELEKAHGRWLGQNRDVNKWTAKNASPHAYFANPEKVELELFSGQLTFKQLKGVDVLNGEGNGFVFWASGALISRVAGSIAKTFSDSTWVLRVTKSTGPSGTQTVVSDIGLGAVSSFDVAISPPTDQVGLDMIWTGGTTTMESAYALLRDLRVNGVASSDTFYAYEVLQDLAGALGFNTLFIESSGVNALPLDWIGSQAGLADYIVGLLDWRWLISSVAVSGEGLVHYFEAGPWAREWTLFKGSRARPNLKPQQRRNMAVIAYKDVGGAERLVRVRSEPDPLAKYGVTRTIELSLDDVQPNSVLADVVGATYAQRYSQKRWVGDIDAADARDDAGRGDARLVKPGDIGRLADWGPSEETFHRIHGVEQTQTTVRYSVEAPISAAPLVVGPALERARRPSEAVLPELEPPEPSGIPSEEQQHRERFLPWPEPFKKPAWRKIRP